jgi:hypothetical protein
VPIAYVTLINGDRVWGKATLGYKLEDTPRDATFCGHAIIGRDVLVVPDARADPRFADNHSFSTAPASGSMRAFEEACPGRS